MYSPEKRITLEEVVRILNITSSEGQNRMDHRPCGVISYRTDEFNEKFKNMKILNQWEILIHFFSSL